MCNLNFSLIHTVRFFRNVPFLSILLGTNAFYFGLREKSKIETGKKHFFMGSGCGAVGGAVASDTRGPRFKSSHRQNLYVLSTVLKRRN